jgi:hypothetical protein
MALTVRKLIEQLQKINSDYIVYVQGCDCDGKAGSISVDEKDQSVMIERAPEDLE